MAFTVTVHHESGFLLVEGTGPATLPDLCGFVDLVACIAAMRGYRRAVMNLTGVQIALAFTDHLTLGAHAAERLRGLDRVASIVSVENRKGSSEKAAQKMGLHLMTFTSLDEGLAWIGQDLTG